MNAAAQMNNISIGIQQNVESGGIIAQVYNALLIVAYGILIVYFLINVYEEMKFRNITAEYIVKEFLKLLVAYFVLTNAMFFMVKLVQFAGAAMAQFADSVATGGLGSTTSADIDNAIKVMRVYAYKADIIEQIVMVIRLFIPYFLLVASQLVVYVVAIGRGLQIILRISFAPLVLPNLFSGGKRSVGIKYLKSFFAIALQAVAVVAIMYGAQLISAYYLQKTNTITDIAGMTQEAVSNISDEKLSEMFAPGKGVSITDIAALERGMDKARMDLAAAGEGTAITDAPSTSQITEGGIVDANAARAVLANTDIEAYKQDVDALVDAGRAAFKKLFGFKNIIFVLATHIAAILVLVRSKQLAEDIVGA